MRVPIFQVDAFTAEAFKGNPAGVCFLQEPRDESWMQKVAREMNLSETAFLEEGETGFSLRWFTPRTEVRLCGHATLATAHVLYETGRMQRHEEIRLHTLSGTLTAWLREDRIEMDFPALPPTPGEAEPALLTALGTPPAAVCRSNDKLLLEFQNEAIVRGLKPDFRQLKSLAGRGVMVTAPAQTPGFDFVSRYFAPWVGIDEDPVTGSAHCSLGPYWSTRLGKQELRALQVSDREGVVHVDVRDGRVVLGGEAVTVFSGDLLV